MLDPKLGSVQYSICSNSDSLTRALEPGAPSLERRFRALKILASSGILTAVRLNPLIPTFPDGYFTDQDSIRSRFGSLEACPSLPFFDIGKASEFAERVAESGSRTLIVGFARMSKYANIAVSKSTEVDFRTFFRKDIPQDARDKRYTSKEIAAYYDILRRAATGAGLRFTTCYIGNGLHDYYAYQPLWTNKADCCDIRGQLGSFSKTCQDIPWSERLRHATKKDEALTAMKADKDAAQGQIRERNTAESIH